MSKAKFNEDTGCYELPDKLIIQSFLKELNDLCVGKNLLEQLYIEIGPYNKDGIISNELMMELNNYFKFDDSE